MCHSLHTDVCSRWYSFLPSHSLPCWPVFLCCWEFSLQTTQQPLLSSPISLKNDSCPRAKLVPGRLCAPLLGATTANADWGEAQKSGPVISIGEILWTEFYSSSTIPIDQDTIKLYLRLQFGSTFHRAYLKAGIRWCSHVLDQNDINPTQSWSYSPWGPECRNFAFQDLLLSLPPEASDNRELESRHWSLT